MLNAFGFVIEMARQTPVWVWALFAFLMFRGTMALNGSVTSLPRLAIVPVAFAAWGLWSVATGSHEPGLSSLIWAASFAFGAMLGALRTARTPIQVDRAAGLVALPGSPMVLVLVLVVFSVKYALGAWAAIQPGAALSPVIRDLRRRDHRCGRRDVRRASPDALAAHEKRPAGPARVRLNRVREGERSGIRDPAPSRRLTAWPSGPCRSSRSRCLQRRS